MNVKFLHVPKTAGSSVRWFLRRFFQPQEVCPAAYGRQLRKMPVEQLRAYRMFAGHFDWADLDRIDGPCFTFTVLRDPVERVVSYYFFLRSQARKLAAEQPARLDARASAALDLPPDEFFGNGCPPLARRHLENQLDNYYAYYFAGRSTRTRERMPIGQITEDELLARANRNLDVLDGLYSTDNLSPLKKDIIATFGPRGIARWQAIPTWFYPIQRVRRNRNSGHFASRMAELKELGATHRTFDRIEEMTRLDRIIWTGRFHRTASMRATL